MRICYVGPWGKKKPEEMAKQREIFIAGAGRNDVEEKQAAYIFDMMEMFAGYGFNKPHSVAYVQDCLPDSLA